jgi:hypothetical protein
MSKVSDSLCVVLVAAFPEEYFHFCNLTIILGSVSLQGSFFPALIESAGRPAFKALHVIGK